jgi:hypothetical protein
MKLISRRGDSSAELVLRILRTAQCAPLTAAEIKAVELLLFDDEFAGEITKEEIVEIILSKGDLLEHDAKLFAATHRLPQWKALARVIFRSARRRGGRTDQI